MYVLLALMLAIALPWRSASSSEHRTHVAGWTLAVRTDTFRNQAVCRLSRGGAAYERQALRFHPGGDASAAAAVYRVDGGPPVGTRSDAMDLAKLGLPIHGDGLTSGGDGTVFVPLTRIAGARQVSIQLTPGRRPAVFQVDGLAAALDAAHAAGCGDYDFVVSAE